MDEKIQVCAVYPNGLVRVYDRVPKNGGPRRFVRSEQFSSYGKAVQFAIEFEAKEREELARQFV